MFPVSWTRRLIVIGALVIVAAPPAHAMLQVRVTDTAEVRTSGTARRSVRPDRASFTIQFTADGATPARAGGHLAVRADSVRRALMALGIPRDSLVTGSTWYWWPERIQVLTSPRRIRVTSPRETYLQAVDTIPGEGNSWSYRPLFDSTFRAREIIEVRLGDPAMVGPAIDVVLGMGITQISRITFSASNTHPVQLEALREATEQAYRRAEAIAVAGGGVLGRTLSLGTESDSYSSGYGLRGSIGEVVVTGAADRGTATEITAPSIAITVTVYGRWQLLRQ